jgi:hypothetical protein
MENMVSCSDRCRDKFPVHKTSAFPLPRKLGARTALAEKAFLTASFVLKLLKKAYWKLNSWNTSL